MTNKDEILARLANGEDAQAIADSLAKELNDAINEYQEQEKAKKENAVKQEEVGKVFTAICDLLEKYYPDMYDPKMREITPAEMTEGLDNAVIEVHKLNDNIATLDKLLKEMEKADVQTKRKDTDPISEFLNEFVNR